MKRIQIIAVLALLAGGGALYTGAARITRSTAAAPAPGYFNARDFGARGDGVTDDYAALQSLAAAVTRAGGGTVYFPPGRYRINQHRITDGPNRNNVSNITYSDCDGLTLLGYGAVIEVDGRFHRSADTRAERDGAPADYHHSNTRTVTPFVFRRCRNFRVLGFELDGNVDEMTRDSSVAEAYAHGIATQECSDYLLQDITVHHFQTDGIYLGGSDRTADRRARLVGVRSYKNARQGLSVIQLRGGVFIDCAFEDTGRAEGRYGTHAPGAGVDVEPNHRAPRVDVNTGDLHFQGCTFRGNARSQFQCGMGDMVEGVRLEGCTIVGTGTRPPPGVILAVHGGEMRDCRIVDADVEVTRSGRQRVTTAVRTSIFSGPAAPIRAPVPGEVIVEDNQIIHTRDGSAEPYAALLAQPGIHFRRNTIWLPDSGDTPDATPNPRLASTGNRVISGPPPPAPR